MRSQPPALLFIMGIYSTPKSGSMHLKLYTFFFKDATYAHEPFQAHEMLIASVRETLHLSQKREDFPHVLGLNFQVSVSALCSGIQSEEQTEQLFSRREK